MKIMHINSVYGIGSTGRIVEDIHNSLLQLGHQSSVICGRSNPVFNKVLDTNTVNSFYSFPSFINHVIKGVGLDMHGLYSSSETIRMIKLIERVSPDIIHVHNLHGFYVNYDLLFKFLNSSTIKVIWTLHDAWAYTGFCSHYVYNGCYEWKNGCKKCSYRDVYPYRLLSNSKNNYLRKKAYFSNSKIIFVTPSNWLKKELADSFLLNNKCYTIPNGVDLNRFYPDFDNEKIRTEYHINDKEILLSVSNIWTKQKGFNELLELSELLYNQYILVLIGLNKHQMRIVSKYKNIIGIDRTTNVDELRKWYSIARVFLNLSVDDTYPTVNIESIACGTPLVTYDVGGASELGKRFGYTVKKGEIKNLLNAISKIKKINCVTEEFSRENMIRKYIDLYEKVLEEK